MDLSKLPTWTAYLLAPAFMLLCSFKVILRSESPLTLTAIVISAGLVCAAILHVYVIIKRRLSTPGDS